MIEQGDDQQAIAVAGFAIPHTAQAVKKEIEQEGGEESDQRPDEQEQRDGLGLCPCDPKRTDTKDHKRRGEESAQKKQNRRKKTTNAWIFFVLSSVAHGDEYSDGFAVFLWSLRSRWSG